MQTKCLIGPVEDRTGKSVIPLVSYIRLWRAIWLLNTVGLGTHMPPTPM